MNIDDIQALIQRLEGSSITSFTFEDERFSLSLEFGVADSTTVVAAHTLLPHQKTLEQGVVVKSPDMGVFYHHHPFTEHITALSGKEVTPDIIIGYVVVETKIIPVYPPKTGMLEGYSVANANVVGYGDTVATII